MRGLLIFGLALLAFAQGKPSYNYNSNGVECPPGESGKLLPNPSDCGSFYECLDGTPILEKCPPGLEWSIQANRCDYPELANCKETEPSLPAPSTTAPNTEPPAPMPDKCPAEDGDNDVLLPNPADCSTFFKCLNGNPILIECPSGLEWSIKLSRCEYPEIAQCKETNTKPSGKTPDNCPAEDGPEDVLLPNPADCNTFFKCSGGKPILENCPPGLQWSIELTRCEYPEIAKCHETATNPPQPSTPAPATKPTNKPMPEKCPAEDGPDDVLLPNPADCGSFFKCLEGKPVLIKCPPGLQWSIELTRCEYPEVANCHETATNPPQISTTPATKPTNRPMPDKCPAEDGPDDVLLPNPADCGSFFKCLEGKPVLIKCPPGLKWSTELTRCEYPEIAKCHETATNPPQPSTATPVTKPTNKPMPGKCPAEDGPEDVYLPNPADCNSFFKCAGGVPVLEKCPSDLQWSIELSRCEYPEIAQCKETSTENKKPIEIPKTVKCAENDGQAVFLADPYDCNAFYVCHSGVAHRFTCPDGLEWSPKLQQCDFPIDGVCEAMQHQQPPKENDNSNNNVIPPKQVADSCPAENGRYDVLLPNPDDCHSYYQCDFGVPILKHCPEGTLWNARMVRCDFPNQSQCSIKN